MKHVQAGLVVGAIWFLVLAVAVSMTAVLSLMLGEVIAASVVVTTIMVIVGASIIDWYTERRNN